MNNQVARSVTDRSYRVANREKIAAQRRAYYVAHGERIRAKAAAKRKKERAAKRRALRSLPPIDYIPAAKARVAADPLRHWRSPTIQDAPSSWAGK